MGVTSRVVSWHSLRGRRDTNQDAALVRDLADGRVLVAVADGMGGHEGGAEASRRALDALHDTIVGGGSLEDGIDAANSAVYERAASDPSLKGMGTTLVVLLGERDRYRIANVGDSRAYRVEDGRIRQLTVDHSFASEALDKGMSKEEIDASPWSNALTRAVGTDPQVEVDVFGPFSTETLHWICLCTDGLYRMLSDDQIMEVVSGAADVEGTSRRLADLAYAAGASDNITVALFAAGDGRAGDGVGKEASGASGDDVAPDDEWRAPSESPELPGGQDLGSLHRSDAFSGGGGSWPEPSRSRQRRRRLSTRTKVELWGVAITVILAALVAYVVLNVL